MQFFIPMQPPTTTHNAKQLHAFMRGGKPCAVLHDSPELKATRAKLHAYLAPYAPPTPAVARCGCWSSGCFPLTAATMTASGAPPSPIPTTWKKP